MGWAHGHPEPALTQLPSDEGSRVKNSTYTQKA